MSSAQHRLALPSGYELGRYRFKEILGSGGFGITYLAEDTTLGRRVAIKELLPNDIATRLDGTTVVAKTQSEEENLTWARERFVGEGRALAACDHPNVINVFEMVEANGTAYMVTKYEDGKSFEQWLRDLGRPPTESELRSILMPLLSGLETVHAAGFLHRDIKPDNIYITKNGRPVFLDFGSARQAISTRSTALTSIVTSGYAPFEQYHEDGNQGAWSDIYALSAVMYRAITGKKPPEATRRLKDDPSEKLASVYGGRYSADFLKAIDRGLTVNEAKRPQTVGEWEKMFGTSVAISPDEEETRVMRRPAPMPRPGGLNPAVIGAAAGAIVVLGLVWWLVRSPHKNPAPGPIAKISPTAAPSVAPQSSPETSASPGGSPGTSPPAVAGGQVDPRLVGTWETSTYWILPGTTSPQSRKQTGRWEQSADGHYNFSGPFNDSGTVTAADGVIKKYSTANPSSQGTSFSYEFASDKLLFKDGGNVTEWHRTSSETAKRSTTGRGSQPAPHREKVTRDEGFGRHFLKKAFRHFP